MLGPRGKKGKQPWEPLGGAARVCVRPVLMRANALICSTAMPRPSSQLLELAKRGAEVRLQDLIHEAQMLIELFPHLRDSFDKDELPISFIVAKGSGQLTPKRVDGRRRRRMSPAARR